MDREKWKEPPAGESRLDADREEALKLWVVLSRARAAVARHSRADIARHGLSEGEFAVLELLLHKGPLLLGEVQRKILVSSGGITYIVDRLEAKALVERRRCDEDRRAVYAALTEEGERLIQGIFPAHAAAMKEAVVGLSPEERRQTIDLLRRLGKAAEAAITEVPAAPSESTAGAAGGSEAALDKL